MAAVDTETRGSASACIVGGGVARERSGKGWVERETVAAVLGAEVRGLEIVADPVRRAAVLVERRRVLRVADDEVVARVGVGRLAELRVASVLRRGAGDRDANGECVRGRR